MNPEEQIQQGASEQPDAPQEVMQTEAPQPEQTQTETAQTEAITPTQPEPTAPSQPVQTAQPTPIAPVNPKEKKGKSWIIILIIILALLLALFGAIWWTGSKVGGAFGKFWGDLYEEFGSESGSSSGGSSVGTVTPAEDNPIIAANNKMRNELGSFDYTATITSNAMDMSIDTTMSCTFDGKNKLEYCNTELFMGLGQEVYYDWENNYEYTKTVSPYTFTQTDESWTKSKISQGTNGALNISDGTTFKNLQSEVVDGGTKYTGKISGFTAATEGGTTVPSTDMDFEIIINNDGYIETITMSLEGTNMNQDVTVKYSNFGTAQSLSIPAEALNAE